MRLTDGDRSILDELEADARPPAGDADDSGVELDDDRPAGWCEQTEFE